MTEKRNKCKKENKPLLQTFTEKCSNSVYGFSIRQDIQECYKGVTQQWMKTGYDESIQEWYPLKKGNIMVQIKNRGGVDE